MTTSALPGLSALTLTPACAAATTLFNFHKGISVGILLLYDMK